MITSHDHTLIEFLNLQRCTTFFPAIVFHRKTSAVFDTYIKRILFLHCDKSFQALDIVKGLSSEGIQLVYGDSQFSDSIQGYRLHLSK